MSTLAAKLAETKNTRGTCAIRSMLADLDAEDVKALQVALSSDLSITQITQVLRSEQHLVSATTVGRHRRGQCACG